jgi:hypothetical protein
LATQPIPEYPSVITPGTSGYYVGGYGYVRGDSITTQEFFFPTSWCLVINGAIVYGPSATPPPVNTAQQGQYQGRSYYQQTIFTDFVAVECYNFDYTSLNTSAITDILYSGQNGQDVFNFNTTDTGGGGGGGGGARGGNGGAGRGSGGGGFSGHNGLSLGTTTIDSTGRLPYTNEYYPSGDIAGFNFDTARATPTNGSRLPYRNPYTGWQSWMYQHAVCFSANPIEYSVNFPVSGTYTFNMGADYAMTVSVDGTVVASLTDYGGSYTAPSPREFSVPVTAGTQTISIAWSDDGGTAGFALTIAIPGSVGIAQGGQAGVATNGGNGYVVLEFQTGGGGFIKDGGEWKGVQTIYVNDQGVWKDVKTVFVNDQGVWKPVQGGTVPLLNDFYSFFGAWPRPYSAGSLFAPPPPAPDYSTVGGSGDGWGYDTGSGGGGGGGKVICTALYELGYMEKEIFEYDQAYGLWLYQNDFVSYRGYRVWADVLVKLVKGQGRPVLTRLLFWKTYNEQQKISQQGWILLARIIGGAFSKEIARRAGHDVPFSIGGWLCVTVGLTVNKAIGYVVKKIKTTSTIDYKE